MRANHFSRIEQALQTRALRLGSRAETSFLAREVKGAIDSLRAIQETFSEVQEERVSAIAEILYSEGRLREAISEAERDLQARLGPTTPTLLFLHQSPSELLRNPSGQERLKKIRVFVTLMEDAPSMLGLAQQASFLRKRLFALEDALRRYEVLLLAEANAQIERAAALDEAQKLLEQLSFLFPEEPERPLHQAA